MTNTTETTIRSLRDLDALVAEKLFGWQWWIALTPGGTANRERAILLPNDEGEATVIAPSLIQPELYKGDIDAMPRRFTDWYRVVPHYTTWAGMESVIRVIEAEGWGWELDREERGDAYWAVLRRGYSEIFESSGNTAPVAFCLAALASRGVNVRLELE
jgi:hypothetical protein